MMGVMKTLEAVVRMARNQMRQNAGSMEPTDVISCACLLLDWKPGQYEIGAVVAYDGQPWKCTQTHDSTGNDAWKPGAAASLWAPYHSRKTEWALPWVKPTGAHDAYQNGEYMIWTDGGLYRCKQDNTVWSPAELPEAWEKQEV